MVGVLLLCAAAYVALVRVPAAYPVAVKVTGTAVVSRAVLDRLAKVYLATGAVGGFGAALVICPLRRRGKRSGT